MDERSENDDFQTMRNGYALADDGFNSRATSKRVMRQFPYYFAFCCSATSSGAAAEQLDPLALDIVQLRG